MRKIGIDFENKVIFIMMGSMRETQILDEDAQIRDKFQSFIPSKYQGHYSFTWSFDDEVFCVNQEQILTPTTKTFDRLFVPELMLPMNGLAKRWNEMLDLLDMEVVK